MPEKNSVRQLNQWRQQELITAHRLNQMVSAINFLLKTVGYLHNRTALANYDVPEESATSNYPGVIEKVTVSQDVIDPFISYGNLILPKFALDCNDITALGQPFKFSEEAETTILAAPVYGLSSKTPTLGAGITPYYLNITTDEFGEVLTVTPSETPVSHTMWDGKAARGNISVLTGALGTNRHGKYFSIDCNPVTLPVMPVSAVADGEDALSLISGYKSNSVMFFGVKGDDSVSITQEGNVLKFSVKKDDTIPDTIKTAAYNLTATAPSVANGTITINGAQSGAPGVIAGINVSFYEPSEASASNTPPKPTIKDGVITIYVPKVNNNNDLDVVYDLTASEPSVVNGQIRINGASYAPSDASVTPAPGVISAVNSTYFSPSEYSDEPPQPTIRNSVLSIPIPVATHGIDAIQNTTDSDGSTASPGINGWIQTMYVYGVWSGQMNFYESLRQLMRIHNGELQIVNQRSTDDSTWYPA